ncbi:MAG: family 20 glycosylhydrolase, partial [Armatimonadota bacterium]
MVDSGVCSRTRTIAAWAAILVFTANACLAAPAESVGASSLKMRGIMIDMIRLIERDKVYIDMLEQVHQWKMNTLFLHFTDSNGCTLELKTHPELVSRHAMTQETLAALTTRGREIGVDIVPEVEAWGHAGWITSKHPDLAETGSDSLCISNESIYPLLDEVIKEVAGLFPGPYIHIGMDEATFAKDEQCLIRAKKIGQGRMMSEHINRVNAIVQKYGKTSIIWADVVLRYPDALNTLDKSVICENWDYKSSVTPDGLRKLKAAGLTTIAAPALVWNGWRLMPSSDNLENVCKFALQAKAEGAMGLVATIWVPTRWVPGSLGPGIAWTGAQCENPGSQDLPGLMKRYSATRFGIAPTANLTQALVRCAANVGQEDLSAGFWWKKGMLVSHSEAPIRQLDMDYSVS